MSYHIYIYIICLKCIYIYTYIYLILVWCSKSFYDHYESDHSPAIFRDLVEAHLQELHIWSSWQGSTGVLCSMGTHSLGRDNQGTTKGKMGKPGKIQWKPWKNRANNMGQKTRFYYFPGFSKSSRINCLEILYTCMMIGWYLCHLDGYMSRMHLAKNHRELPDKGESSDGCSMSNITPLCPFFPGFCPTAPCYLP